MAKPIPLPLWDRDRGKLVQEFMDDHRPTYESRPQLSLTQWLQSQPVYDRLYAAYQNTRWSARQIEPFVQKHKIDMSEYEAVEYRSFGDFFDRNFRPGVRSFPSAENEMGAFAEARYFGWERLDPEQRFPIKGHSLSAEHILGTMERARPFVGGPVIVARLSPVDYHHVHYPDSGTTLEQDRLGSRIWTVNWHALQSKEDILFVNERQINVLDTRNLGRLAFVEVGALTVGRIVQKHPLDAPYERGQEKSMFRFGGSAIVVFGEPGAWRPSEDILAHTREGVETFIRLGEPVAERMKMPAGVH